MNSLNLSDHLPVIRWHYSILFK